MNEEKRHPPHVEMLLLEAAGQTVFCPWCLAGVGKACRGGSWNPTVRGNHRARNKLAAKTRPEEFWVRGLFWWHDELRGMHKTPRR